MHYLIQIIVLLVSLTFAAGVCAEEDDPWEIAYEAGVTAQRNKQLPEAADFFGKALDIALTGLPTGTRIDRALYPLVAILTAQQKYSEARKTCQKVIDYYQRLADDAVAAKLNSQEAKFMGKIQDLRVGLCRTIYDDNEKPSVKTAAQSLFPNNQSLSESLTDNPYKLTLSAPASSIDNKAEPPSTSAQSQAHNKNDSDTRPTPSISPPALTSVSIPVGMTNPLKRVVGPAATKPKIKKEKCGIANPSVTVALGPPRNLSDVGSKSVNESSASQHSVKLQPVFPKNLQDLSGAKPSGSIASGAAKAVPVGTTNQSHRQAADMAKGPLTLYCDRVKSLLYKGSIGTIKQPVYLKLSLDNVGKITQVSPMDEKQPECSTEEFANLSTKLRTLTLPPPPKGLQCPVRMRVKVAPEQAITTVGLDVDFSIYMKELQARIKSQWQPSRDMSSRRVVTIFKVWRDGRITDAKVDAPSGNDKVDERAIATVNSVSPVDPLPDGGPEYVDVQFVFDYNVFVRGNPLRQALSSPAAPTRMLSPQPFGELVITANGDFHDEHYLKVVRAHLNGFGPPNLHATFVILRSGELSDVKIVQSSGSSSNDIKFAQQLRFMAPFPPLPATAQESIEFTVRY